MPKLDFYVDHCKLQSHATLMLGRELKVNPAFKSYHDDQMNNRKELKKQDLASLLSKTLTRLARYPLVRPLARSAVADTGECMLTPTAAVARCFFTFTVD